MVNAADEVSTLMVQKFGVDPAAILPEVPLHQLRMDSLALEEFRLLIEDRLDIDLEDTELTSRDTVGRLIDLIHSKILV